MTKFHVTISRMLTYGTVLSLLLIVLALIEMVVFQTPINTYSSVNIIAILDGLFSLNPTDTLYCALLAIIFTPIANLVYIALYYISKKDVPMIMFSIIVFCILLSAIIMGLGS